MRILVLLLILAIHDAQPSRILGLFPHTGKSHQMVFDPLLKRLAERGHQVTVVSFFPVKNTPANYTDVSLEGLAPPGLETVDMNFFDNPNEVLKFFRLDTIYSQIMKFQRLVDLALGVCSRIVDFPPLADVLKKEYDVILVESFKSDCMLGLAHIYGQKAPFINLLSTSLMDWLSNRIGVIDNPSYVPVLSSEFTSKMNFMQRLENSILNVYYKLWYRFSIQMKEKAIIEKHFGRKLPDLQDLGKNVSLMLINTFHSLNGPRPLVPGLVEVGGMHLDHTRKAIPPISTFSLYSIDEKKL